VPKIEKNTIFAVVFMRKMRGLGDLIYYITKYTGIKWLVGVYSKWTGKDCGCEGRREKMNVKLPFE
jgi:hypothetical protein